jgi:hypothetical protein
MAVDGDLDNSNIVLFSLYMRVDLFTKELYHNS